MLSRDSGALWRNLLSLSLERKGGLRIFCTYYVDKRAVVWVVARGPTTCQAIAILSAGSTRMLESLTCRKIMPQLKCNVGRRKGNFVECAHQGAVIRDIAGRRFTLALWTLYITMFGVVARDNNATTLLSTLVIDFSRTCVVVAVYDALRACTIWDVGDEVGMGAGWK